MSAEQVVETEAILVRSTEYGDTHKILTFLTAKIGKVSAIARGAKRSKRRYPPGMLQPFQLLQIVVSQPRRGDLLILKEADVVALFPSIPADPARYALASYVVELVRELTPPSETDADPLNLLHRFLSQLEREGASARLLVEYLLRSLDLAGLAPLLDRCADCGKPAPAGAAGRFDPLVGLVCSECRAAAPVLRGKTREGLLSLARGEGADRCSDDDIGSSLEPLLAFSHHQLGRELRGASLLRRFLPGRT